MGWDIDRLCAVFLNWHYYNYEVLFFFLPECVIMCCPLSLCLSAQLAQCVPVSNSITVLSSSVAWSLTAAPPSMRYTYRMIQDFLKCIYGKWEINEMKEFAHLQEGVLDYFPAGWIVWHDSVIHLDADTRWVVLSDTHARICGPCVSINSFGLIKNSFCNFLTFMIKNILDFGL